MNGIDKIPLLKISFVIESKDIDCDDITEQLSMPPTSIRGVEDWPETIKNGNLPDHLQPRNVWELSMKAKSQDQIETAFSLLTEQLLAAKERLEMLKDRYFIWSALVVALSGECSRDYNIPLPVSLIMLMHELGAEIRVVVR